MTNVLLSRPRWHFPTIPFYFSSSALFLTCFEMRSSFHCSIKENKSRRTKKIGSSTLFSVLWKAFTVIVKVDCIHEQEPFHWLTLSACLTLCLSHSCWQCADFCSANGHITNCERQPHLSFESWFNSASPFPALTPPEWDSDMAQNYFLALGKPLCKTLNSRHIFSTQFGHLPVPTHQLVLLYHMAVTNQGGWRLI